MSSSHHQHHHHPHLIPPPFPYSIGSGSGGGGGGGGGGGRPSPNNTISTPTSASTLYTSPEDSTIVIPKTEHDDDDDEEASSPDSVKNSHRPPKKKQRRNKPTLSCQECVERKTKVSCFGTHFSFFLCCCHLDITDLLFLSFYILATESEKRSACPDRHAKPLNTPQNKFVLFPSCFYLQQLVYHPPMGPSGRNSRRPNQMALRSMFQKSCSREGGS